MLKNSENNGTEKIGLVTPTLSLSIVGISNVNFANKNILHSQYTVVLI